MERRISIIPITAQVLPIRIGFGYQLNFLLPQPTLDGFFSDNSGINISECFKIYQPGNIIFFRKAGNKLVLMPINPFLYVIGNTDIERLGLICHNVNVVLFFSFHNVLSIIALNTLSQTRDPSLRSG